MKHFSKVLSSTQSDTAQAAGYVEKLELPKNAEVFQVEPDPVFRLFELFDRAECVGDAQDEGASLPSLAWCWALCSLSNAPADVYSVVAGHQADCAARIGGGSIEVARGNRPDRSPLALCKPAKLIGGGMKVDGGSNQDRTHREIFTSAGFDFFVLKLAD